ncbi:hypothetical protein ACOMHN_004001 [Nucella lapillus]
MEGVQSRTKPDFRQCHLSDVTSALGRLWRCRLYTDLTLVAQGKCSEHIAILSSASPYFHCRLFNGKRESCVDQLFIKEVSGEVLSEVVEFVYSGACHLREDNAEDLLRAAAVFQIVALKDMCDYFLRERVQAKNALRLNKVARATGRHQLEERSLEVLRYTLPLVLGTKLFRQINHHDLISITASLRYSQTHKEETVQGAIKAWLQADKFGRKQALWEILKRVPLPPKLQEDLQLAIEDLPQNEKSIKIHKTPEVVPKNEISTDSIQPEPTSPDQHLEEVLLRVGGIVAVDGGYQRSQRVLSLPPSAKQCLPLSTLPLLSDSGAASCNSSHHLYISGVGDSRQGLIKYHSEKNSWQILAPMSIGRRGHSMVILGPCLYVLGGVTNTDSPQPNGHKARVTAVVENYNTLNNTWSVAGNLAVAL